MHERPVPPTGAQRTLELDSEYQDWARLPLRLSALSARQGTMCTQADATTAYYY